jgi:hypothetical protein
LAIHLFLEFLEDEVGTRSLDQVPFFFLSACAPGSTVSPFLAALLLLAWLLLDGLLLLASVQLLALHLVIYGTSGVLDG